MTLQPLPERPNLEQLKNQAKSLLHAARDQDRAALARFRALPAFSGRSIPELGASSLALHDAQAVIAREHGFKSWRELREHVEEQSLSFAGALEEFIRCATGSAPVRALRLLALHPGIARANLYTEIVLGDAAAVRERLRRQPEAARVLLAHGARADALERMFSGTPLVWAAHAWSEGAGAGRDHIGVARQLIAAGSPLEWHAPEKAPDPERLHEALAELCRAAAASAP